MDWSSYILKRMEDLSTGMQKNLGQASSLSFTMSSCLRNHVHGARNGIIFSTEARILHVRSLFQFEQSVVSVHIKAQVSR